MKKIAVLIAMLGLLKACGEPAAYTPTLVPSGGTTAAPSAPATAQRVTAVSAAMYNALAILDDGTLWTWGSGVWVWDEQTCTALRPDEVLSPVKVMDNVIHAAAGDGFYLAVTADGVLWELDAGNQTQPIKIMENITYAAISPVQQNAHASTAPRKYAIAADGTLWGWGGNMHPYYDPPTYLGDGTAEGRASPVRILDNVASVTPTHGGGYAVKTDGTLWWWGRLFVGEENGWWSQPQLSPAQTESIDGKAFTGIWDFDYKIADGHLWTWGLNRYPQQRGELSPLVGCGTLEPRDQPIKVMEYVASVTDIANTVFVITDNGGLWAWGPNAIGQLGDGTTELRLSPVKIMDNVAALTSNYFYDHSMVGLMVTYALTRDGALYGWGGKLHEVETLAIGDGTTEPRHSPVRIEFKEESP